ncbi:hypothetical protein MPLDJ20_110386 [Mesorhizobium plurifarium]|uniref:Uncharacterized protein n=1 Tax=Mesorhizobium plurifarium TaxID=69974 RepID=A0A090FRD0_MESPL|nr:hypothetical protein MPLDJ20_110386 [Mesorhizobium plurifarium]
MPSYVKDAGVWKPATVWVKDAGIWKQPPSQYVRDAGVWKRLQEPVSPITFLASAVSTTTNVVAPASIQAGDLLVYGGRDNSGTVSCPPGFTLWDTRSSAFTDRHNVAYKIADGTEAGASLAAMNGGTPRQNLLVFRPNFPLSTLVASTVVSSGSTSSDPSPQAIASSGGVPPLVVIGMYSAIGDVTTRTFTVSGAAAKDGEVESGSNPDVWLAYKIYNGNPADVVIDMPDSGNDNCLQGGFIQCA